jgi:hypothetical protein
VRRQGLVKFRIHSCIDLHWFGASLMPIRILTEVKSLILDNSGTENGKNEEEKSSVPSDLAFSIVKHMGGVKRTTFLCVPVIATSTLFSISPYISCNQSIYSETGFHYGVERSFVSLWRRPNCRSQVILQFTLYIQSAVGWFSSTCYFT